MAENKSKLQRTQSNPKMPQLKECPLDLEFIQDSKDNTAKLQRTKSGPKGSSVQDVLKVQRKKSNSISPLTA